MHLEELHTLNLTGVYSFIAVQSISYPHTEKAALCRDPMIFILYPGFLVEPYSAMDSIGETLQKVGKNVLQSNSSHINGRPVRKLCKSECSKNRFDCHNVPIKFLIQCS